MNEKDDDLRPKSTEEMLQASKELIDNCETETDYIKIESFMHCAIIVSVENTELREGIEKLLTEKAKQFGLMYKPMGKRMLKQSDKKISKLARQIVKQVYDKVLMENP